MAENYTTYAETFFLLPEGAPQYAAALDWLVGEMAEQGEDWKALDGTGQDLIDDARAVLDDYEELSAWFGTSTDFQADGNNLYIASGESGDVEAVAAILHAMMRRFSVDKPISFQWADHCSKLRSGEFGGGAVVITKDGVHWMGTHSWVDSKIAELTGFPVGPKDEAPEGWRVAETDTPQDR